MSMKELDIASFAESLVTEQVTQGNPVQFAAPTSPDAPDISHVKIPDDFASQVLTEAFSIPKKSVEKSVEPSVDHNSLSEPLNEATIYKKHLVEEYKKKVADLEDLIKVMESMGIASIGGQVGSGHIGINTAGPAPDPDNPHKPKRRAARRNRSQSNNNDLHDRINRRG